MTQVFGTHSTALSDTYAGPWQHAPGQVFAGMAAAIADGAGCVSHIEAFGDHSCSAAPGASTSASDG